MKNGRASWRPRSVAPRGNIVICYRLRSKRKYREKFKAVRLVAFIHLDPRVEYLRSGNVHRDR